jgi:hypothetical protein
MYKRYFNKPNLELSNTHRLANSRICKLHTFVPGPASQDAVIQGEYASLGLQGTKKSDYLKRPFLSILIISLPHHGWLHYPKEYILTDPIRKGNFSSS